LAIYCIPHSTLGQLHLPTGTTLRELTPNRDDRGCFTELFRNEWATGIEPIQWNMVSSNAGVLRGVHVHIRHADYLTVASGTAIVGLQDFRKSSPTFGHACTVTLSGQKPAALHIPVGVAHGFYFPEPSIHIYAVSEYWDDDDELGCHWRDPGLRIEWPFDNVHISHRDEGLPGLANVLSKLPF
jgi:dTDP-4-dehydrorhamnose 3,5-epimerase